MFKGKFFKTEIFQQQIRELGVDVDPQHVATESAGNLPDMAVCQNLVPLVNIKIAGKWMFIPLKMVLIGIDPYPYHSSMIH